MTEFILKVDTAILRLALDFTQMPAERSPIAKIS
jgi:hypothetical protein